jgi:hypothetical protein
MLRNAFAITSLMVGFGLATAPAAPGRTQHRYPCTRRQV